MTEQNENCNHNKAWKAFLKWFVFSALVALVPLFIAYQLNPLRANENEIGLKYVIGNGELLLVVVSFCAASMGETVSIKFERSIGIFLVGINLLIIVSAAAFYGNFATLGQPSRDHDRDMVMNLSLILFGLSYVTSGAIVYYSALHDQ